jgi:hypothetical protein
MRKIEYGAQEKNTSTQKKYNKKVGLRHNICLEFFTEVNGNIQRGKTKTKSFIYIFFFWIMNLFLSYEFIHQSSLSENLALYSISLLVSTADLMKENNSFVVYFLLSTQSLILYIVSGVMCYAFLVLKRRSSGSNINICLIAEFFSMFYWVLFIPFTMLCLNPLRCVLLEQTDLSLDIDLNYFCDIDQKSKMILSIICCCNLLLTLIFGFLSCVLTFKLYPGAKNDCMKHSRISFNVQLFLFSFTCLLFKFFAIDPRKREVVEFLKHVFVPIFNIFGLKEIYFEFPFFKQSLNKFFFFLHSICLYFTMVDLLSHILDLANISSASIFLLYAIGTPFIFKLASLTLSRNHNNYLTTLLNKNEKSYSRSLPYVLTNFKLKSLDGCVGFENLFILGSIKNDELFSKSSTLSENETKRLLLGFWREKIELFKHSRMMSCISIQTLDFLTFKALYLLQEMKNYTQSYFFLRKTQSIWEGKGGLYFKFIFYQVEHMFKREFSSRLLGSQGKLSLHM